MIVRVIEEKEGKVMLLCKNGSIRIPTMTVLANLLENFNDAKNFSGDDGSWNDKYGDMAMYPGKTLAYVTDEGLLVIHDSKFLKPVLKETYEHENYISSKDYAAKVGMSHEIIKVLCRENRIAGAHKKAGRWLVPADAPYPIPPHRRRSSGRKKVK